MYTFDGNNNYLIIIYIIITRYYYHQKSTYTEFLKLLLDLILRLWYYIFST